MQILTLALGLLFVLPAYSLDYGMCEANASSKRYLNDVFSQTFPKTVKFKCLYNCMTEDGIRGIWGSSSVTIRNQQQDATDTVCQGVKVKRVSWGWDMDGTEPFYIFQSDQPELRDFARRNISRNNPKERELLIKLAETTQEVAQAFQFVARPGFEYFAAAAKEMLRAIEGLPDDTTKLDAMMRKIRRDRRNYSSGTAEALYYPHFKSYADFRN